MPQDIKVEKIGGQSCEPIGGFNALKLYYADIDWFDVISAPKPLCDAVPANEATTFEELAEIPDAHTFKAGYGFMTIEAEQEGVGLVSTMIGEKGRRMFENKLAVIVAGSGPELQGFSRWAKNRNAIILAVEAGSGRVRQLGSERIAATISEFEGKVEQALEGENGKVFTLMDKQVFEAPIYKGAITEMPAQS